MLLAGFTGSFHEAMWQSWLQHAGRHDAGQEGWEVKTITRHIQSLCSKEASRDLLRRSILDSREHIPTLHSAVTVVVKRGKGPLLCRQGFGLLEKEEGFWGGHYKKLVWVIQYLIVEKSGRLQGSTANEVIAVMFGSCCTHSLDLC